MNLKKSLFSFLLLIIVVYSYSQAPKDSLVLYYAFNNNIVDQSGNGYNGIHNGITFIQDRFFIENSALYFDGVSNKIDLPNNSNLKPDFPFSISTWVSISELPDVPKYFFRSDNYDDAYSGFWLGITTFGQVSTGYGNGAGTGGSNRYSKYSDEVLKPDIWYNIIVSFIDSYNINIYINGNLDEGTYSGSAYNMVDLGHPGAIGYSFNRYFKGKIDDLRIYNKALTEKELPYIYYENPYYTDSISVTDTLFIDVIFTGINNLSEINTIKIYPNPTKKFIFIELGDNYLNMKNYSINIINSNGQNIFKTLLNQKSFEIDIDSFKKRGIYFVQILNDKNEVVEVRKIVLE